MDDLLNALTTPQKPHKHRRNNGHSLTSFLKGTLGNAFLTFFQQTANRKPSLKENEENIKFNFQKINEIVDSVDEHIAKRLQNHEEAIYQIAKGEIAMMKVQAQKLVQQLNRKITDKNINNELWHLSNELDYFKIQTLKLFEDNNRLRLENKLLKKSITDFQIELNIRDLTMQKLRKKYLKEKFVTEKIMNDLKAKMNSSFVSGAQSSNFIKDIIENAQKTKRSKREHIKTEHNESNRNFMSEELGQVQEEKKQEQSLIEIHLSNNNAQFNPILTDPQNQDNAESISIPSLTLRQSMISKPGLPEIDMKHVESFICGTKLPSKIQQKFVDKSVQTQLFQLKREIRNKQSSILLGPTDQKSCSNQKKIDFSNKFSFNTSALQKQKKKQFTLRQRQTVRFESQQQKSEEKSLRYMSSVLTKNRLQTSEMFRKTNKERKESFLYNE